MSELHTIRGKILRLHGCAALTAMLFVACIGGGCAAPRVYPPVNPPNPTLIYLCDYGVHSSILLPNGDGRFVEYVYGDWAFAVENKDDPLHTLAALFVSFQPALGRRYLTPPPGRRYPWPPNGPHTVRPMIVDGERVAMVVKDMDQRYRRHIETEKLNDAPNYNFTFVRDDQHYSIIHSCNHMTMRNLTLMGCDIVGWTIGSNFIVGPPGGGGPQAPGPFKLGRPSPE
jgi:hypothetical protein